MGSSSGKGGYPPNREGSRRFDHPRIIQLLPNPLFSLSEVPGGTADGYVFSWEGVATQAATKRCLSRLVPPPQSGGGSSALVRMLPSVIFLAHPPTSSLAVISGDRKHDTWPSYGVNWLSSGFWVGKKVYSYPHIFGTATPIFLKISTSFSRCLRALKEPIRVR